MELKEIDYLINLSLKARSEIIDKQETIEDDSWMDQAALEFAKLGYTSEDLNQ